MAGSIATVKASARANRGLAPQEVGKSKYDAINPAAAMYGVFGPQYAALLAQPTDSAALQVLNAGTLQMAADREQQSYSDALDKAQAAQQILQREDARYGFMDKVGARNIEYTDRGMGGAERVVNDAQGRPMMQIDPLSQQVANGNQLNNDQADRFGVYASGVKAAKDAGYAIDNDYVGKLFAPPTQMEPVPVRDGMTPSDTTARYAADQGLTYEQQLEKSRVEAEGRIRAAQAKGDDIEVSYEVGEGGVAKTVYKGTPEALIRNGINPQTGQPVSPNAGANRGTAPASPATKPNAVPIQNGRAAALAVYPQLRVTQVQRDPNSKLGKANPDSWHNRSSAAIDSAALPNMSFDQYVDGYKKAGYEIIEAIDEYKNPSKHATGKHWHVVLGKQKDVTPQNQQNEPAYAARLRSHPSVAKAVPDGTGNIVVTLKNGRTVVYNKGKRVG